MSGKKIVAGIFAILILFKLVAFLVSPAKWLGLAGVFLSHSAIVLAVYLVLLAITGYFAFSSVKIIDIAIVMFFTSLLIGITLFPYYGPLLKVSGDIAATGLGKSWYAVVIWVALALAVLAKVLSKQRR
jgi:hypothetical protein